MTVVTRSPQKGGEQKPAEEQGPLQGSPQQPHNVEGCLQEQDVEQMETNNGNEVENAEKENVEQPVQEMKPEDFPVEALEKLDEMIGRPRWVVPVLPGGELEVLLQAATQLCSQGLDTESDACQRFFRDGLTTSFTKIMTDDAVSGWKFEIHKCILRNCERLVDLCVIKLEQDWFPLLELLAMVFNPHCKFHQTHAARGSEYVSVVGSGETPSYAKPMDQRAPRGWLVDLINRFGERHGFEKLLHRITKAENLTVPVLAALIRPFGLCSDVLAVPTIKEYFLPVIETSVKFLEQLSDSDLRKESKSEAKNESLSGVIKFLKQLCARVPGQEEMVRQLEVFRLSVILRLLQVSSFNGKMNALNEVNKVISSVSYYSQQRHHSGVLEEDEFLSAAHMTEWISSNGVLSIVLRDSLHQPQYVEKLEKIIRFMIKEKSLGFDDLDKIWDAQVDKHEAIVKNVHDLLAKLAWDFLPEQLDYLFKRFQQSWADASRKPRERLLELIRRLAEDDKEGVMATKVLSLLYRLARTEHGASDVMEQALAAHVKILDYSCSQERDAQKMLWLEKFIEEVQVDKGWVLPALRQIRAICLLFSECPQNYGSGAHRSQHLLYRNDIIVQLQNKYDIVRLVSENLVHYMQEAAAHCQSVPDVAADQWLPDGRSNHTQQVAQRLKFLKFLLKDGRLWLYEPHATHVWSCLAQRAVFPSDREACFKWFHKLMMSEESDLDPHVTESFFEKNVLQLDPTLLTENGMLCVERFFKAVNIRKENLQQRRRGGFLLEDIQLVGLEYLWRVVLLSTDEVAERAITLLKDVFTNLGPKLLPAQVEIEEDFIQSCTNRLRAMHDTLQALRPDTEQEQVLQEATRMVRVLTVLREYVAECDDAYAEDRALVPLGRAARGRQMQLVIRLHSQNRQPDDLEVWSHGNETMMTLRRSIVNKVRMNTAQYRLELYVNGELQDARDDRRLISHVPLRDKMTLAAKCVSVSSQMRSSPDSSSDSSGEGGPHFSEGPNQQAESCLPGVLLSKSARVTRFLLQLADQGASLNLPRLRDTVRALLNLMPADAATVSQLRALSQEAQGQGDGSAAQLNDLFSASSPALVAYTLQVLVSQLVPANDILGEETRSLQLAFISGGGLPALLRLLTQSDFLAQADADTKRSAYTSLLRATRFCVTVGCYSLTAMLRAVAQQKVQISATQVQQYTILNQALGVLPPHYDIEKKVAQRLGEVLQAEGCKTFPDLELIHALQRLAWAAGAGELQMMHAAPEQLHEALNQMERKPVEEDVQLCREALELLSLCVACVPSALEQLQREKAWQNFIVDMVLVQPHRSIRQSCAEQLQLMVTKCSPGSAVDNRPLLFLIQLLMTKLSLNVKELAAQSEEYFVLLSRLLQAAYQYQAAFMNAEHVLNRQIQWLAQAREQVVSSGEPVEEALLAGNLSVCKELLSFVSSDKKHSIGCEQSGPLLLQHLIEDFLFPASTQIARNRSLAAEGSPGTALQCRPPVCQRPPSVAAGFELIVALCQRSAPNLCYTAERLTRMFYSEADPPLSEWEYLPPVGPRPERGFVGLKNAGATCYMNSILQQLFMIRRVREGVLSVPGLAEHLELEQDSLNAEQMSSSELKYQAEEKAEDGSESKEGGERAQYNLGVLRHLQNIFGHLHASQLQYFVPKGFWSHFKLWGEPVNLREQHDALEFFNSLVDSVDEALKFLRREPVCGKVMAGMFADQKICKDCPHRYQREESFTTLNVDVRNQSNLHEALEQYVKGDLLEGANAYHCEKCDRKVDTVKRMCIKQLPPVLALQLKRFDYDWERECAIKFNDYFEFPRKLDMAPYTVQGLAKIEGEVIDTEDTSPCGSTCYRLVGVVVHSGQASGGHYYSYILHRQPDEAVARWYKFDDGEVSEYRLDDDEEMKTQCFGGEYIGEVFDHMLKKMSVRRQKRWWNAYILFYERQPEAESQDELTRDFQQMSLDVQLPAPIERLVRRQNMEYMHTKSQFSVEYFQFMSKLIRANHQLWTSAQGNVNQSALSEESEVIAMQTIQLAAKFLFHVGFHTKKALRGAALEWHEMLTHPIRASKAARSWLAKHVLLANPALFSQYLLQCPSAEVRNAVSRIILVVAHFTLQDGPSDPPLGLYPEGAVIPGEMNTLSDHILVTMLNLLVKQVPEHSRHLAQYFNFFYTYATFGAQEKQQLLRHNVPTQFILLAVDEGPGPAIRSQYPELGKLYAVVGLLVRCCDVSANCQSSVQNQAVMPNPYAEQSCTQPLMMVQQSVAELLFARTAYVKKLIEDGSSSEDTSRLLRYCCWENSQFSRTCLAELLWQVAFSYTYELRPHLDLLLQLLLIPDSWQNQRIVNSLKGVPDDREGLFDTIQRSKSHYQKRAYQCLKMMVELFAKCQAAMTLLQSQGELKRRWSSAVDWLTEELEKRPYVTGNAQYTYSSWSPPAQSNETSNGYYLERSNSAKATMRRALELLPEEEQETSDGGEQSGSEEYTRAHDDADDLEDESGDSRSGPRVGFAREI